MSIQELVQNAKKEEGKIEGKAEGKAEGFEVTLTVIDLINEGKSLNFICDKMNVSKEFVESIKAKINKNL